MGERTALAWFSPGAIASLMFLGINWANKDYDWEDIFPITMLVCLGMFSALIVGVIGLMSLSNQEKIAEYATDQFIREARSGLWGNKGFPF